MRDVTDSEKTLADAGEVAKDTGNDSKSLPAGIVPPNKTSTAPTLEIQKRFAPGSAPHWVGASAASIKENQSPSGSGTNAAHDKAAAKG